VSVPRGWFARSNRAAIKRTGTSHLRGERYPFNFVVSTPCNLNKRKNEGGSGTYEAHQTVPVQRFDRHGEPLSVNDVLCMCLLTTPKRLVTYRDSWALSVSDLFCSQQQVLVQVEGGDRARFLTSRFFFRVDLADIPKARLVHSSVLIFLGEFRPR
jgi:hypothetical protein